MGVIYIQSISAKPNRMLLLGYYWEVLPVLVHMPSLSLKEAPLLGRWRVWHFFCLFVAFLAFFIGEKDYKKSDWAALIICSLSIPLWKFTDNPMLALAIIVTIDILSYWPTMRKSFNKPHTEPPISAVISCVRYLFMILAVPEPAWGNIVYPLYLMLVDMGFAAFLIIRRAQLGYPLHEYVREAKA